MAWKQGVARVTKVAGPSINVACPHCPKEHTHDRRSLGSKEVVAGCHVGFSRCLSYAIPERPRRGR